MSDDLTHTGWLGAWLQQAVHDDLCAQADMVGA